MEPITIRIHTDTKQSLEDEAAEYNISVSEYVRRLIEKGREYDKLQDRLDAREDRINELETQLSRRSQIEEKVEALPDQIRDVSSYAERRQRLLDQATLTQRMKWKITGVPIEKVTDE